MNATEYQVTPVPREIGGSQGLRVTPERPVLAIEEVRGRRILQLLCLLPPHVAKEQPGWLDLSSDVELLVVGPAERWWISEDHSLIEMLRKFEGSVAMDAWTASDISEAIAVYRVTGADVRELLSKGCGIDLHEDSFVIGDIVQTRFAKVSAIIRCVDSAAFEVMVFKSYASYIQAWLFDAAAEFSAQWSD